MTAQKMSLHFKKNTCRMCEQADPAKLRQGRGYCQAEDAKIRNGHCTGFKTTRPKPNGQGKES